MSMTSKTLYKSLHPASFSVKAVSVILMLILTIPSTISSNTRQINDLSVNSVGPILDGGYYQAGNYQIFANVSNIESIDKSVDVSLSIISESFSLVFSDTVTIIVPAKGHALATFETWSATEGKYFLNVSIPNDLILTNNYINYSFTIYTLIYDKDLRISAKENDTQPVVQTNISLEVMNMGNQPASNFNVNLTSYISDSPVLIEDSGIPGAVPWSFEDLTNRTSNWKKWTSPVHSGTYSYASKLSSTSYGNNIDDSFVSPEIDLTGTTSPKLTFWHIYSTENGHDGGYLQVKNAIGEWVQITPIGGYNAVSGTTNHYTPDNTPVFGGDSGGWLQAEFSLSAFVGLKISFRFVFTSDDAGVTGYSGWFIDDINVSDGENVIFFDDAEGSMKFTPCYLPTGNFWHIEQNSYTTSPAWVCSDSTGNYRNLTEQSLLSPLLNLSNFIYAELSFDHRCDVLSGDHGSVQVSSNGGTTWTEILNVTDVLSWTHVSLDLMPYISSNVRIRFKFHSSTSGSTYGWIIDNIRVNGTRFLMINSQSITYTQTLNPSQIASINFTFVPPFEDIIQFTAQVMLSGDSNPQNDFANFSIKFINIKDFAITNLSLNIPSYPCVLIINFGLDSGTISGYEVVKSSIENTGLQCDVWNVSEYGVPTSNLLDTYSLVVLSINNTLDSQNASIARNLKTYLSHGGRAIVYGAYTAYYLSLVDIELVRNYFKIEHLSNLSTSVIISVDDTVGEINDYAFQVGNSALYSILSPQAVCCLKHANFNFPNAAGIQIYGENYRCVILGFDISMLGSTVRYELLSNSISFLGLTNLRYPLGFNLEINATVWNLGNVFGTSQVELNIENLQGLSVYSTSTTISLPPQAWTVVQFTWTVGAGSYVVKVTCNLAEQSGNNFNNELSAKIFGGE
ncbi:MAG: immune inhibitor A, partial [Thermoplasmata archaeon]